MLVFLSQSLLNTALVLHVMVPRPCWERTQELASWCKTNFRNCLCGIVLHIGYNCKCRIAYKSIICMMQIFVKLCVFHIVCAFRNAFVASVTRMNSESCYLTHRCTAAVQYGLRLHCLVEPTVFYALLDRATSAPRGIRQCHQSTLTAIHRLQTVCLTVRFRLE